MAADVLSTTYHEWREDRTIRLGAGLAYYGLFAIVPLLALAAMLAGLLFSRADVESFLDERVASLFGVQATDLTAEISKELDGWTAGAGLGLIGLVSLLIAASFVFVAFQDALNVIFDVPFESGIHYTIRRRLLSFAVVLLTGSLLLGMLAVQAVQGVLETLVPGEVALLDGMADLFGITASVALGALVLAVLFHLLTFSLVRWRYAFLGAAVTAVGLAIGAWGVGKYFEVFGVRSIAGVAGGALAVLFFIYYEAQIVLAGAQLTKVVQRRGLLGGSVGEGEGGAG